MTRSQTDQHLLACLRDGDVAAFTAIVLTYGTRLEEFVFRMVHDRDTARDIVQDVFSDLWQRRAEREIRTTLQGYLYGSARNHTLVVLRRARLEEQCAIEFLASDVPVGVGERIVPPDIRLEHQELASALVQALATLSPRVRQVALLRWRDRLSRPEIAAALEITVPTVNNQLTTAARVLRRLLAEQRFGELE